MLESAKTARRELGNMHRVRRAISSRSHWCALLILVATAVQAHGADVDEDRADPAFMLQGFGTLGLVHSSEDRADFVSGIFKPNGAGYSRAWSADVDSRLGVQATAQLAPGLSAVLQVVAKQRYDNTYGPDVEWANIKYDITPDFNIRFGRTVLPVFMFADTANVGYSYPWVRPPLEVYRVLPVTNQDGIDATYRLHAGDWTNAMRVVWGWKHIPLPHNARSVQATNGWAFIDTAEYGALTLRASYFRVRLTAKGLNTLFDAYRLFGPQGNAIADEYDPRDRLFDTRALGVSYDPGDWFVTTEWGTGNMRSALGSNTAWYVSGGFRHGEFTPYLTYSRIRADMPTSDPGIDVTTLPPPLAGLAGGLNAVLNKQLGSNPTQYTISAGMRWDFRKNVDFKMQLDHTRLGGGTFGLLTNVQPDFQRDSSFNVFSLAFDFVF